MSSEISKITSVSRESHILFLNEEFRSQLNEFEALLNTKASYLLEEKKVLFVGKFLGVNEQGQLLILFNASKRSVPKLGSFLSLFSLGKQFALLGDWNKFTYKQLLDNRAIGTEGTVVWLSGYEEEGYKLAGVKDVDEDFVRQLKPGMLLVLGPQKPPLDYIRNLITVVEGCPEDHSAFSILDVKFNPNTWRPTNYRNNILDSITLDSHSDTVILQGPPGTGKTTLMAEICAYLINFGESVLVTAFTNRALMEVAGKPALKEAISNRKVEKVRLSLDEKNELPDLSQATELAPHKGKVMLATFYQSSKVASLLPEQPPFDFVFVDESSQAFLAMLASVKLLGRNVFFVGDHKQLPPISVLNTDVISRLGAGIAVNGLETICNSNLPFIQKRLSISHRFSKRAAEYTGLFYDNNLESSRQDFFGAGPLFNYSHLSSLGGPELKLVAMKQGDRVPGSGIKEVVSLVKRLYDFDAQLNVAVLTIFNATTVALQNAIFSQIPSNKKTLVNTVASVQGVTCDYCIYMIPNDCYFYSLNSNAFNVATSRARYSTFIVADKSVLDTNSNHASPEVGQFFSKLRQEQFFNTSITN